MTQKRVRSMRNIPTIQGLRNQSLPTTREQAVTELARLEHEKARLERELKMWVDNQKKTEMRLRQVDERLLSLQEILEPAEGKARPRRRERRSTADQPREEGEGEQTWREIPLEY
jgi:hypothetical protein